MFLDLNFEIPKAGLKTNHKKSSTIKKSKKPPTMVVSTEILHFIPQNRGKWKKKSVKAQRDKWYPVSSFLFSKKHKILEDSFFGLERHVGRFFAQPQGPSICISKIAKIMAATKIKIKNCINIC